MNPWHISFAYLTPSLSIHLTIVNKSSALHLWLRSTVKKKYKYNHLKWGFVSVRQLYIIYEIWLVSLFFIPSYPQESITEVKSNKILENILCQSFYNNRTLVAPNKNQNNLLIVTSSSCTSVKRENKEVNAYTKKFLGCYQIQ